MRTIEAGWTNEDSVRKLGAMSGRNREMVLPVALLIAASATNAIVSFTVPDGGSGRAEVVARCLLALLIANWVLADARQRRLALCYDYDSFLFFAYPIVGLAYLIRTRRWRAAITMLWFAAIIGGPHIIIGLAAKLAP